MRYPGKKRWYVYLFHSLVEDVGDYIGITYDPIKREKEHRYKGMRKPTRINGAIKLFGGENFVFYVIDECAEEGDARFLERKYIKQFGTAWPKGLNVAACGLGSMAYQYETRRQAQILSWEDKDKRERHSRILKRAMNTTTAKERNSEAAKLRWANPEYRAKQRIAATGKKHSEETKQLLREKKLAASAARGGPKDRRKYPGLNASEIGKVNWEKYGGKKRLSAYWNSPEGKKTAAARITALNNDPAFQEKRIAGVRAWHAKGLHKAPSAATRKKMSKAQKRRNALRRKNKHEQLELF